MIQFIQISIVEVIQISVAEIIQISIEWNYSYPAAPRHSRTQTGTSDSPTITILQILKRRPTAICFFAPLRGRDESRTLRLATLPTLPAATWQVDSWICCAHRLPGRHNSVAVGRRARDGRWAMRVVGLTLDTNVILELDIQFHSLFINR